MAQQLKTIATKPDNLSQILGSTWYKEKTDSFKLSSDLHMHVVTYFRPSLSKQISIISFKSTKTILLVNIKNIYNILRGLQGKPKKMNRNLLILVISYLTLKLTVDLWILNAFWFTVHCLCLLGGILVSCFDIFPQLQFNSQVK